MNEVIPVLQKATSLANESKKSAERTLVSQPFLVRFFFANDKRHMRMEFPCRGPKHPTFDDSILL